MSLQTSFWASWGFFFTASGRKSSKLQSSCKVKPSQTADLRSPANAAWSWSSQGIGGFDALSTHLVPVAPLSRLWLCSVNGNLGIICKEKYLSFFFFLDPPFLCFEHSITLFQTECNISQKRWSFFLPYQSHSNPENKSVKVQIPV